MGIDSGKTSYRNRRKCHMRLVSYCTSCEHALCVAYMLLELAKPFRYSVCKDCDKDLYIGFRRGSVVRAWLVQSGRAQCTPARKSLHRGQVRWYSDSTPTTFPLMGAQSPWLPVSDAFPLNKHIHFLSCCLLNPVVAAHDGALPLT